ncbi:hypothetical protein [Carboxydothermus pertinax]|uniref:Uncharacterized protein n=1 Tax=Carboxydothermus pertinax TaxID=870242 RepID=A0A1L8CV54_9THEO|nr:hypothetical protein [Carboxydothermus pertinax]GAV22806.1 hypothetical protein cpu_13160 [Carboxydothermus pertinax]
MRTFFQLILALIFTFYLMLVPSLELKREVISLEADDQAVTAFKPSGSIFNSLADGGIKRALSLGLVRKLEQEINLGKYILYLDEAINDATRIAISFYLYSNRDYIDLSNTRLEVELLLPGAEKLSTLTRLQMGERVVHGYIFSNYLGKPREVIIKGGLKVNNGSILGFEKSVSCPVAGTVREVYVGKSLGGTPEIFVKKVILAPTQWAVVVNLKGRREELEAFRYLNLPVKLYSDGNILELLGVGSSIGGIPPRLDEYFYFLPGGQEKGALLGVSWPDGNTREIYIDFARSQIKPRVEITPIYDNVPKPPVSKPPIPAKPAPGQGQLPLPASRVLKGIDWVRQSCKELLVWIPEKNYAKIREISDEVTALDIKDAFRNLDNFKLELVNFNYQEDQNGYLVSMYVEIRNAKDNSYLGSSELVLQFVQNGEIYKLSKFSKN